MLPAKEDGQHPAKGTRRGYQRFGLEAGAHNDGTVQLAAPLAEVLPGIERTHAVAQQKVGHPGVERLGLLRHGVQIVQHGAVAVRLGKIAVIGFGADGSAMAQVIVAGD